VAPGVIVFDRSRVVRAISPSARQLLTSMGIVVEPGDRLDARKSLAPLLHSIEEQSRVQGSGAAEAQAVVFAEVPGEPVLLVRVTEVARGLSNESDLVAFIEPAEAVAERAQRSKLAAMGRMSGSIAHEIRNPLASITQAAELLAQDPELTASRANARLVEIVRSNALRINHIIEDVLAVTRVDRVQPADVDVAALVRDVSLEVPSIGEVQLEGRLTVWFDPLHLRLTLINLLRNARRHARSQVSVRLVRLRAGLGEIQVIDDGPLIAPEVRTHLFEPFHTTERSGTGLGLYLAREYCVANRAQITYEERGRAETPQKMFVIRLRSKE
ncbi:MAG TPA: HAMP domain-containing sensor histidine kinase, partial [Burkholderiaceae bacterium]|nr:HAMP domain-containing sensor histidine kinase [Burkholderiaceae bacterium]